MDLRKVDGEKNLADLLTEQSISRQPLDSLLKLYSCRYIEGRAESAHLVRSGEYSKKTMASAHIELPTAEEEELVERHERSDTPIATTPHHRAHG